MRLKPSARARQAIVSPGTELFRHELRKDGRPVASLVGLQTHDGVLVEAEIYPATEPRTPEPMRRPFAFASEAHAVRFADETLLALEYLGCS